jgi:chromate transporter
LRLLEITRLFFRFGFVAFGGPAAHIAMMDDEFVERRKWITRQHFLDLVGATNLIPGPNSTEMVMHLGYERGGLLGMIVAGVSFILPAAGLTGALAWAYVEYGALPAVEPFLVGIKPAVIAIILAALWKLGKKAAKGWRLSLIGASAAVASLFGAGEIVTLAVMGLLGTIWLHTSRSESAAAGVILLLSQTKRQVFAAAAATGAAAGAISLTKLGLFFLKIGSILYGSGYVLIAFLEGGLVNDYGWLTKAQLLDAVAAGQFTPGPVLTTATFIGYVLMGWRGASVSTLGIFLPSFVFVAILNPIIPRLRKSPWSASFLDAVNAAALGLMAAVVIELARSTLITWQAGVIAVVAAIAVFLLNINSAYLVLGGALLGWVLFQLS